MTAPTPPEQRYFADYERKDGLFLTQGEWNDLALICQFWLDTYRYKNRRKGLALALRIIDAARYDGRVEP